MTTNNMQFNSPMAKKNIPSFVETGLPENISEPDFNFSPESKNTTSSKISNRVNTET